MARREAATLVVHEALVRLARRIVPADHRDEVAQDVLVRLWKARPSSRRYTSSDGEAEAYLKTALGNRVKDIYRKNKRDRDHLVSATADDGDSKPPDVFVERRTPEDLVIREERDARHGALLDEAMTHLFDKAIPEIARGLQNPGGFLENIARPPRHRQRRPQRRCDRRTRGWQGGDLREGPQSRVPAPQAHTRLPPRSPRQQPRWQAASYRVADARSQLAFDLKQAIRDVAEEIFAARVQHGSHTQVPPDEVMTE